MRWAEGPELEKPEGFRVRSVSTGRGEDGNVEHRNTGEEEISEGRDERRKSLHQPL